MVQPSDDSSPVSSANGARLHTPKKRKLSEEPKLGSISERPLACPFYKAYPAAHDHDPVCSKGWPTFHRLKEHLLRKHSTTDPEDVSVSTPTGEHEGQDAGYNLNFVCRLVLKRRSQRVSDVEKWRRIYILQFPGRPLPSPYVEQDAVDAVLDALIQFSHDSFDDVFEMPCRAGERSPADTLAFILQTVVDRFQAKRRDNSPLQEGVSVFRGTPSQEDNNGTAGNEPSVLGRPTRVDRAGSITDEEGNVENLENPSSQAILRSPYPPSPQFRGQSSDDDTVLNPVLRTSSSPTLSSPSSNDNDTGLSPSPRPFTFTMVPPISSDNHNPGLSPVPEFPIPIDRWVVERPTMTPCYSCGQHRFISNPPTFEPPRRVYNLPVYNPPVSPRAISPPPYRPSGGYVYQSQPMGMPPSPGIPDGLDSYVPYWAFTPRQ